MTQSRTIAVAGAGLVGRLIAWRLLRQGHRVTLFEAGSFDRSRSAAHTAAAMISPMSEVVVSERSIYDMGLRSLQLWPRWLAELNTDAPTPVTYSNRGSIAVAHHHDLSELEQFYGDLNYHLGQDNNAEWLDSAQLRELEPDLSRQFEQGLYLPGEAHLDNRQLLARLIDEIRRLGGDCREHASVKLTQDSPILSEYDLCIDCRGLGARNEHALRGVRGEVLWVETDEVHLQRPIRLMHPRYKLYAVPKPSNRYIIGATEIESDDQSPVSVQSMLELCSALYTLNPAFAEARVVELDANLRPAYLDNMPRVELDTTHSAPLLTINGLYRHGYLLAPKLVEEALARIQALDEQSTQPRQSL